MSIHPTAIIDRKARLHESVTVGPHCIIDGPVEIQAGTRLYHNVFITGHTTIGEDCVIHPGAIVGHEPQDLKYCGEPTYCRVGARTVIREYATIHRGTDPETATVVGEDCFLMAGAHVAHNCHVGNHVTLINDVLLGGHVQVQDRATLGGNSVAHQFVRIGELAMIAGHARIVMDVIPFAMCGTDGRIAGLNRIGLRRAAVPPDQIADIRRAFRILLARGASRRDALAGLREIVRTAAGKRLLDFVETESRRGLAGRSRRRPRSTPEAPELP